MRCYVRLVAPETERLWETEPERSTCLAKVVDTWEGAFRLDRSLFRPKSRVYRHPQRHDEGTIWVKGGNKHNLVTVFWRDEDPWHRIDAPDPPDPGTELQCHLDRTQRDLDSRAHTGMHLLLAAIHALDGPSLAADPEVKGGGRFRLELATWTQDADAMARWLDRANQYITQDQPIQRIHVPRDAAPHKLDPQSFGNEGPIYPGPEKSLQGIEIPGICTYPCDGTHAQRTSQVGSLVIRDTHLHGDGRLVIIGEVPRASL